MAYGIRYGLKEAILGFQRAPWMSFFSVLTISLSLLVLGVLLLITINLQQGVKRARGRVEMEAFLEDGLDSERVRTLEREVGAIEGVESVDFVSKDEALATFREEFGDLLLEEIDGNPLPASFIIQLKDGYRSTEHVEEIAHQLVNLAGVNDVEYGGVWVNRLNRLISISWIIVGSLGIIIGIACILVTSNTINLTIFARREVIEIMKLVGATDRFIRRPFVYEGVLQGFLGGLFGVALLVIALQGVLPHLPQGVFLPPHLWPILILLGMIMGGVGSRISLERFLRA